MLRDGGKSLQIAVGSEAMYMWTCDDTAATSLASAMGVESCQVNTWYVYTETEGFQIYDGISPIALVDITPVNSDNPEKLQYVNQYLQRIIDSF